MENSQLHQFIEDYVCQDNPDIQWSTANRYEFYSLASDAKKQKKIGRFYNHQEIFLRYIRQYDKIFNIQGTGTGKSGSIINVAEYYKSHNEGIKRVYVIQPGPPTVKDFKNQITKLSDPNEYSSVKLRAATTEKSVKNNLSRLIKEWYSVTTYQQFAKNRYNDQDIKEIYSDCIIFMDEAHKLRNLEDGKGGQMSIEESENVYQFLWKVTHLAERSKIIISSATPMINDTIEFAYLANLLLPMDFQLPINVGENFYNRITLSQLEPFLRGKITFIKFLETKINIKNMGEVMEDYEHCITMPKSNNQKGEALLPLERKIVKGDIKDVKVPYEKNQPLVEADNKYFPSQIKIYTLEMQDIQLETYLTTIEDKGNFFSSQKQSSIFVYPNGQFGGEGFKRYIKKDQYGNYIFNDRITYLDENNKLQNETSLGSYFDIEREEESLENLGLLSCKFKFFIEKELKASKQEKPGNSFCYIEYVDSGALILALILKKFGFEEFKTTISPFNIRNGKLENIEKKKRFVLLTSKSNNIETALQLFNSKENKNGEYVQIIIASRLARDGVNIFNVLRGYILSPGWHESGMHQALSRFIRSDSHDYLYDEEQKKINVEIYRLAAIRPNEKEILYKRGINKTCIDLANYINSEEKNIKIKRIIRFMKQVAFDAYVNYDRNTAENIEPYTSESDYGPRFYKIWDAAGIPNNDYRQGLAANQGPSGEDIKTNTYNIFYSEKNIKEVKNKITEVLKCNFYVTLDKLKKELEKSKIVYSEYIIFQAIFQLVYNNETITNYRNTLLYKLYMKGNIIYNKREKLINNNKFSTENDIYISESYPNLEIEEEIEKRENKYIKVLNYLKDKDEKFIIEYYKQNQNYDIFKKILEESLISHKYNTLTKFDKIILKLMSNYYLILDKPEGYLKAAQDSLTIITQGQGRKRRAGSEAGFKNLKLNDVEMKPSKEKVYIHFYRSSEKTAYAISSILKSNQRSIRVLEKESFRDSNSAESFVYNYLFTEEYEKILKPFEKFKYFVLYILRGGEDEKYIADKEKNFIRIIDNSNVSNKGKVCSSYPEKELSEIIKYADKNKKYTEYYNGSKIRKNKSCDIIKDLYEKHGMMFMSF